MNRDPTVIGRIDVVAETFAGVINSFVDPISWKTMVRAFRHSLRWNDWLTCMVQGFTLVTLSFLVILTNSALFNLRSRHAISPAPPPPHAHNPYAPQQHYLQNQPYPPYPGHLQAPPHHQPQASGAIGWTGNTDGTEKKKGWW